MPPVWSAIVVASVAFAAVGAPLADEDSFGDLVRSARSITGLAGGLRWPLLILLAVCAAGHYVCAAGALQAAAGCRMPFRERVLGQLAASSANRLTPAGLGGSAVNVRFLTVRGQRSHASAVGAVAALAVFGGVADVLLFVSLLALSIWSRLGASPAELPTLRRRVTGVVSAGSVSPLQVLAVVLVAGLLLAIASRRLAPRRNWAAGVKAVWLQLQDLLARPRDLLVLITASASTTLLMGIGLAVAVQAVPGPTAGISFGALVIAYMVGSVISSAVPTPAGIGVTEAGLVGALHLANVPVAHAVQSVLLFRIIVFWAPAGLGVLAAMRLRARGAL